LAILTVKDKEKEREKLNQLYDLCDINDYPADYQNMFYIAYCKMCLGCKLAKRKDLVVDILVKAKEEYLETINGDMVGEMVILTQSKIIEILNLYGDIIRKIVEKNKKIIK